MKHINQVEVKIPEETAEFLESVLDREERCVSVGGLAAEAGLLETPESSAKSDYLRPRGDRLALAARELGKLKADDLERVIGFISGLQARGA